MSDHSVEVIRIAAILPHENADSLGIVLAHGGYPCIVRLGDFQPGDLAAYIPPDSVVPETEQFAFLGPRPKDRRVRAKRLRGQWSLGLLVHAPEGAAEGDDVADILGVVHYEPEVRVGNGAQTSGEAEAGPDGFQPHYDIENLRRHETTFFLDENVIATEKIHGTNGSWLYRNERFWVHSHNEWKQIDAGLSPSTHTPFGFADIQFYDEVAGAYVLPRNLWWRALSVCPGLAAFVTAQPGMTVYGEVYGCVQDLTYGHTDGAISVAVFDIWHEGHDGCNHRRDLWHQAHVPATGWLSYDGMRHYLAPYTGERLSIVPEVYRGPYNRSLLEELAAGPSLLAGANHLREGVVIRPERERTDAKIGRAVLKLVSNLYLERKTS